jgi:hypothetical protein
MRIGISCSFVRLARDASGNGQCIEAWYRLVCRLDLICRLDWDAYDGQGEAASQWTDNGGRDFGRMRGRWISLAAVLVCALPLTLAGCGDNGPPDFTLALASGQTAKATITQGGTTPVQFQVTAVHNSTGSITLVLSGLPPGVGVAPGSATVGIGSSQIFCLNAAANAAVTSAPVTLTATGVSGNPLSSSSITHTQTLTLSVMVPAVSSQRSEAAASSPCT